MLPAMWALWLHKKESPTVQHLRILNACYPVSNENDLTNFEGPFVAGQIRISKP